MIGFAVMLAYTIYIIIKGRCIPQSISATVYTLDDGNKWLFTFIMFAVSFLIAPQLFQVTSSTYPILAWLTVLGLLGVGVDPLVSGERNVVHYVSAVVCGVASQAITFVLMPKALILWMPYIIFTLWKEYSGKNMFVAELVMMADLLLVCLSPLFAR